MRAVTAALLVAILAAFGSVAPVAAARGPIPKVAIIVGPVGATTPHYRALADEAVVVAKAAGAQVVKVYSPYATWGAVKRAVTGASIVVYLGHGNGWPSRYRNSLYGGTQNGFGLNPVAGGDDDAHQYFGETHVGKLRFAPNAVVVLSHLCYASGHTEPGLPEGTTSQAIQRVDNYAAGFIRAGARAVVAETYLGPAYYVRALLSGQRTIEQIWNGSPFNNGHTFSVPSVRTPGYTARLDPDRPSSGYNRSLVSKGGLAAATVRAGGTATSGGTATTGLPSPNSAIPAEPTLTDRALTFDTPALSSLPIAETKSRLTLPLSKAELARVPTGAQVGVRWDPILLDPDPAAATPDVTAPTGTVAPAGVAGPGTSPAPDASPVPTTAAAVATPTPRTAGVEPTAPAASRAASASVNAAARASASASTAPSATASEAPSASPAVPTTGAIDRPPVVKLDPPTVDLVAPERVGSVVQLAKARHAAKGLDVSVTYPSAPGLYRLVPTLHTPDDVAYDAATQALLTPVIVRVGGRIAAAYGIPGSILATAGGGTSVAVRVVNSGLEAWDKTVNAPRSKIAGAAARRVTTLPARLVATWVSSDGHPVPKQTSVRLVEAVSAPGGNDAVALQLAAPVEPGQYLLLLDVVSPSQGPISAHGSAPGLIRVAVTAPVAPVGPDPSLAPDAPVTPDASGAPGASPTFTSPSPATPRGPAPSRRGS